MLILNLNGVRRCSRHAYHAAATPILKSNRCLQAPATLILDWNGVRRWSRHACRAARLSPA